MKNAAEWKNRAITLVELPPTAFGRLDGEPIEDVFCGFKLPARAIPLLHSILRKEGFTNVASINPATAPAGRLSPRDMARIAGSDFLLISIITRTAPQSRELGLLYRKLAPGGTIIVGGPHATFQAEECLEWADLVVRNEGDRTLPRVMETLARGGPLDDVDGISYLRDGRAVHARPVEPLTEDEMSALPAPHYDADTLRHIRVWPVNTSRGCPMQCDFCSVSSLYGSRYRRRSNESIIRELARIPARPPRYVFFTDDNFAARPEKTKALLRMIIARNLNREATVCQLCVAAAFDGELLKLMREARINIVFVGIESICDETLKALNKKVDAARNKEAVRLFKEAGIWVHGMMMIGGDGDTEEILAETARWAREHLDSVQYFAPTPMAGTRFREAMGKAGRILTDASYLYDGQHVVLRPRHLTPLRLQEGIFEMYRGFYSLGESVRAAARSALSLRMLHLVRNIALYFYVKRIFSKAFRNPQICAHLERLRALG
jgi:radical SAM superfamily enzyme YgiQ (UPF0313 family)